MLMILIMCMSLMPQDEPYVVWMTNNKRMKVKTPPRCVGSLCTVELLNGETTSLPSKLVDMERTLAYNDALVLKRKEAKEAAEKAIAEQKAAEEKEKAKVKDRIVILKAEDELPKYDRSNAGVSGTVAKVTNEKQLESRSKVLAGDGPIFVSKETITRYESHYLIECEVSVKEIPRDAVSASVELKASFENEKAMSQTQALGPLVAGQTQQVSFKLDQADTITRLFYTITTENRSILPPSTAESAENN